MEKITVDHAIHEMTDIVIPVCDDEKRVYRTGARKRLALLTGIPAKTVTAWARPNEKRTGSITLLLKLLLTAKRIGVLDELLDEAQRIKFE